MPTIRIASCTYRTDPTTNRPSQETTPLPGIYSFDGWRVQPTLDIPVNLPSTKEAPAYGGGTTAHTPRGTEPTRSPEEKARDILATAAKNQLEDGSGTRRAAIRACKYLRVMVSQHGPQLQAVYDAAKVHTQRSKGSATNETTPYRLKESELPVVEDDLLAKCMMFPSFHSVLVFLELVLIVKGVIFINCLQYLCAQFTG